MPTRFDEIPDETPATAVLDSNPRTPVRFDELEDIQAVNNVQQSEFDLANLSFTQEEVNALKAKGKIGAFEQAFRTKKMEKVPVFGLPALMYEAAAVRRAIGRLQADEYKGNTELQEHDIETARKALRYAAEEQIRGITKGGLITEGVAQLPAYMIEFALSKLIADPGATTAARITAKALTKTAASKLLRKLAAGTVKFGTAAAIRTATVFAPRVVAGAYEREANLNLIPTKRGLEINRQAQSAPFTSFTKALGDVYIEVLSEEAGRYIFNPAFKKMGSFGVVARVKNKMVSLFRKMHPNEAVGKLFTQAGWDGFVSEVGEEVLGDQLRAVFNVEDFGADGNVLDRMYAAIPDGDELAVMMGVLAVPGATNVLSQQGMTALDNYRRAKVAAGVKPSKRRTLAGKAEEADVDPVEAALEEALAALPQVELTTEELAELSVRERKGEVGFEEGKPAPERKVIDEITSSQEFREADRERQMQMLIKGRTAELDAQRVNIEKRMTALEKDIVQLSKLKDKKARKPIVSKKKELQKLSKQLLSTHAQLSDVIDSSAEELAREKILLPGETLEGLRGEARRVGAQVARSEVEAVFRNIKAQAVERRTALVKYLQARLPGPENAKLREKFSLRAAKDMTEAKLQKLFAEVEKLRETVRAKQLRERATDILNKMKPKMVGGVRRGVFANPNIQQMADELVRIATLSAPVAEQELDTLNAQIVQLIEAGEGESEVANELKQKAHLVSQVSGLEQRNADELEDAIRVLVRQLAQFQTGRDMVKELRRAQRKAETLGVVSNISETSWQPQSGIKRILKLSGQSISKLFQFSSFNLAEFWRTLGGGEEGSFLDRMVVKPLSGVSRRVAALQITMDRPVRDVMFNIYGVSKTNTRNFMKFLTERMSTEPSGDPAIAPYLKEVVLNSGETKQFQLSRWDVLYWYASAYEAEGVQDAEAYETLTGENELAAIQEQVEMEQADASEAEKEAMVQERAAKMKGNAIPVDILEDMFSTLTPQDRQFAMAMREIFSSFWPVINPVYRRATGIDMTQISSYVPRIKKTASKQTIQDLLTEYAMIEAHITPFPSSTKERRKTSTAPFAQIGLMDVFMGFRDTMSHWVATHDLTSRMQGYLKNREIRDSINAATDGVLNKKTGQWKDGAFVKMMEFHLKGIASRGRTDNAIRMPAMDLLRRNLSRSVLAKPKQFILQLTSAFTAIQTIGHANFVKGLFSYMRDPVGATKLLNSALSMHNRYQNIMIELKEVQDLVQLDRKRFRDKFNWFDRYAFTFVKAGNKGGVLIGGWAVFKDAYDKSGGNVNKAFEAFDSFVLNTQQSALREQQSALTVGPVRYLAQFVSAVSQYGRVYYRSWNNVIRNPSLKNMQTWARTMVIFHVYIPTVRWMISQIGLPSPEDEEDEKRLQNQLFAHMLTGPISGLWLLGIMGDFLAEAITGQKGYDSGPAVFQALNKTRTQVSTAIQKALDEDAEPEEIMEAMFKAEKQVGTITIGLPTEVSEAVRAMYLHSQGEWDAADTSGIMYGHSIDMINFRKGGL